MKSLPRGGLDALVVMVCLATVLTGVSVGGVPVADEGTAVTVELTVDLAALPAEGRSHTVSLSLPDGFASTATVESVRATGGDAVTVGAARVVDGPDGDGVQESVAMDVTASGNGTVAAPITVTLEATVPSVSGESAERLLAGGVAGDHEFGVDRSNLLVQRVLDDAKVELSGETPVLGVTPPEGVAVKGVSARAAREEGLSLGVPLVRLTETVRATVEPDVLALQSNGTRTVTVGSVGTGALSVGPVSLDGNASAFRVGSYDSTVASGNATEIPVEHVGSGGENATLSVWTDAPTLERAAIALRGPTPDPTNGTDISVTVGETANRTRMDLAVRNVSAGETVSMSMPGTDAEQNATDVVVENMSMTAAKDGDLNMSLEAGANVAASMPGMNATGVEPLGFFSIEHSWSDAALDRATLTVRVNRSRVDALPDIDPESVALYRHTDAGWTEERTTYLGASERFYRYRVVADGYSDWATAGKRPAFQIVETGINVTSSVERSDPIEVAVRIRNDGGADGDYLTQLWLNDTVVEDRAVSIAAGGTGQVIFQQTLGRVGTYEVRVNDVTVDRIEVEPAETAGATGDEPIGPDADGTTAGPSDGGGGLPPSALLVGGIVFVGLTGLALFGYRRRER